jgi:hypothetical protein
MEDVGDERLCRERSEAFLRHCIEENCPPPPCVEECRRQAQQMMERCLQAGEAPDVCRERVESFLEECIEENCPPPKRPCVQECEERAHHVFQRCVQAGNPPDLCRVRSNRFLRECIEERCGPPEPPEPPCIQRCEQQAEELFQQCVQGGGDPALCRERAHRFLKECIRVNCGPPEPDCEAICGERAHQVFRECMDQGGIERECRERAEHARRLCMEECRKRNPGTGNR